MRSGAAIGVGLCILAAGCGTWDEAHQIAHVRSKAAPLLGCEAGQITVDREPDARYRALGCARAVDYECVSRGGDCCAFVRPGVYTPGSAAGAGGTSITEPWGGLSPREFAELMFANSESLGACYARALRRKRPFATGVVEFDLVVAPTGAVRSASVARSSLGDVTTESCILESVRTLRFPALDSSTNLVVRYSYMLQGEGRPPRCQ